MITNKSIPNYEKSLHENFQKTYKQLSELKNNRNKYINSKQVYLIYDDFLSLLHELALTRKDEELKGITLNLPNGNDLIIDDIWQLLSLCFVTCGLIKFAPATYSSLSTVNKLLDHLKECQVYTMDDLEPIKSRLSEIKEIITNSEIQTEEDEQEEQDVLNSSINSGNIYPMDSKNKSVISHKREESLLLRNKLNKCQQVYNDLEKGFNQIPPDLENIYKKLIKIRKNLLNHLTNSIETPSPSTINLNDTSKPSPSIKLPNKHEQQSLQELKKQLVYIESHRDEDGKFTSAGATPEQLHSSQMVLNGLLDDCNNFFNDVLIQSENSDISSIFQSLTIKDDKVNDEILKKFNDLYSKLIGLKLTLENLLITRRWTMRETDLYNYQKMLKTIDEERLTLNLKITSVNQPSLNSNSKNFKRLQVIILYLLRRCYALIYKLLESSEPVSESLQPIHNQLSTVRRCLLEIKRIDGLNNLRELYPFQFKLASLDNLRSDGKFIINNQIPEGQGTLNALLAECFDILHELKIELEEKEEEQEEQERLSNEENSAGVDSSNSNNNNGNSINKLVDENITDDEDKKSDDEVELKRNRYVGFNEADYDQDSESDYDDESSSFSASEYEDNDYY